MSLPIVRAFTFVFVIVLTASALSIDFAASASRNQNANSAVTDAQNANNSTPTAPVQMDSSTQTDLSGTYTGMLDCPDAGVSGETTLTITGNQFTLSDGKTGRITAVTTRGYTSVAMQFGESTVGETPIIVSMRARKAGDRLTLLAVPSSGRVCSFTPAGSRRVRRTRTEVPSPPAPTAPTEPTPPAEPTPTPIPTPTPSTTPMPYRQTPIP